MSPKELTKEYIDHLFYELAKILKKKARSQHAINAQIIVVGGASILLNYSFRETTLDIDIIDFDGVLMNEVVAELGEKHELPFDWINTDFTKTTSYSLKLAKYSTFYKSYCNDTLIVRTVKDEYLVAMKMKSARAYKNDLSDIFGIINSKDINFTFDDVLNAYKDLYGTIDDIDPLILEMTKNCFITNKLSYSSIRNKEIIERAKKEEEFKKK